MSSKRSKGPPIMKQSRRRQCCSDDGPSQIDPNPTLLHGSVVWRRGVEGVGGRSRF
jgi:hypothetical protein